MIKRRIGPHPHEGGQTTPNLNNCPDMFELENGDFAIIGAKKTDEIKPYLAALEASCGDDEEIIIIPRSTLVRAKRDIPNE